MELYLRVHCDYNQTNWARLLGPAAFAYNNTVHSAIKMTPFYATYGYHPRWIEEVPGRSRTIQDGTQFIVKELSNLHQLCTNNIHDINKEYARYANEDRLEPPSFKVGDKVLLKMSNIKTKRPSRKLDWKQSGPYEILEKINTLGYRLKLPPSANIHNVFHVNRLEKWTEANFPEVPDNSPPLVVENEKEYEVREILDTVEKGKGKNKKRMYLVAWKGYEGTLEETSWEPEDHVREHAGEEISNFWELRQRQRELQDIANQESDT